MAETTPVAVKLSRLLDLGFERVDDASLATETEARRVDRRTVLVTTARPAMGTLVSVSGLGRTQDRVEEAIGRAFAEMDRLIGIFSRFDGASALTALNDAGRLEEAITCHMATRSYVEGRKVTWDPVRRRIV